MKKTTILVLVLSMFCSLAFAAQDMYYEHYRQYRSIRSLSMGSVGTTTAQYDEALFSNPARHSFNPDWKISILNPTVVLSSGLVNVLKNSKTMKFGGSDAVATFAELAGDNQYLRIALMPLSFYIPKFFWGTSLAFGLLTDVQLQLMFSKNNTLYAQSINDVGANFGLSKGLADDRVFVGVNTHVLYRLGVDSSLGALDVLRGASLKPNEAGGEGAGVDFDLGVYYKIPFEWHGIKPNAGLSITNLLDGKYSTIKVDLIKDIDATPPKQERAINVGANLEFPEFGPLSDGVFALEFNDLLRQGSVFKHLHIGGEVKLISIFIFRAGLNQGYPTGGLGIDLPVMKINLATTAEELGMNAGTRVDRRWAAQVAFEI